VVGRKLCTGVAAFAVLLAACGGGDSPADGWVSVGTGDTYGEWELFAEAKDGAWTGCLRFPDEDAREACGDPGKLLVRFEEELDGAQYGAVGDDVELEFTATGEDVELIDAGGIEEHRFFVVADSPVRVRR
jgi:hypothetical protein